MGKLARFAFVRNCFSFGNTSPINQNNKFPTFTVSKIIQNQKNNPSFVFQHTKQVCQTISTLFEAIPQNETQSIFQLRNLMRSVHLSGFRSWKSLRQTSFTIQKVLNKQLAQKKFKFQQANLALLLDVLSSLNYELEPASDLQFLKNQVFSSINVHEMKLSFDSLRMIEALSLHSGTFRKLYHERKDIEQQMIKLVRECVAGQENKYRNRSVATIIKNGVYHDLWSSGFLTQLKAILSVKYNLQMNLKGLLNALQLISVEIKSIEQDLWQQQQASSPKSQQNILTQTRIVKILKQMGYDLKTNQLLFNYEVDYKIGNQLIIQYHGIHHYKTNTDRPVETIKSRWKVQALQNRGYKVFVIPFYVWNKLETIYQKKAWLVENLENQLLLK